MKILTEISMKHFCEPTKSRHHAIDSVNDGIAVLFFSNIFTVCFHFDNCSERLRLNTKKDM